MKIRVWYAIEDMGDGSNSLKLFSSKQSLNEYCEDHNNSDYCEIPLDEGNENIGYKDIDLDEFERV